MSFKISKIKRGLKHYMSLKAVRKKVGLTGKAKWIRQLKRGFRGLKSGSVVSSSQPVSASSVGYQHQARTLSQLTGGV